MASKGKTAAASGGGTSYPERLPSRSVAVGRTGAASNFPRIKRQVTYNDNVVEHWISDGELGQLTELRKDNVVEIFWGVLGIFVGSLAPALERFAKIGNSADPVGAIDFLVVCTCVVSLVLTIVMAVFWWQRSSRSESIADTIRNRAKFDTSETGREIGE